MTLLPRNFRNRASRRGLARLGAICALVATAMVVQCPVVGQGFQFMSHQGHAAQFTPALSSIGAISAPAHADLDGDGRAELALIVPSGLFVYSNRGASQFVGGAQSVAGHLTTQGTMLRAADLDADGDVDLLAASPTHVETFLNDGTGWFAAGISLAIPGGSRNAALAVADLDGDGRPEIIRGDTTVVRIARSFFGTWFVSVLAAGNGPGAAHTVCLVDVDGDQDLDLVTSVPALPGGFAVFSNVGIGALTAAAPVQFPAPPFDIAPLDLDGDGALDLVAAHPSLASVMLLRNSGHGFVDLSSTGPQLGAAALLRHVVAADFDGDGDRDIFANGTRPHLFDNVSGTLVEVTNGRWGAAQFGLGSPIVADIDGDADPDLLLGNDGVSAQPAVIVNYSRHLISVVPARIGQSFVLDVYSGPGFAPSALTPVFAATGRPPRPVMFAGIEGGFDLDPASATMSSLVLNSSIGLSRIFLPIPNNANLVGAEVVFQSARMSLSNFAFTTGFSNALLEEVIR